MRPVLEYGNSVWDPPGVVLQEELESMQKCAARFVTGNYKYETWSPSRKRGKTIDLYCYIRIRIVYWIYKGLKSKASIPTEDLIPKTRHGRYQHSKAFQPSIANTDVYKCSFSPRDWNVLPDSLISSAEVAEDCVAKFRTLVRDRD